jgi:hypothetical protein
MEKPILKNVIWCVLEWPASVRRLPNGKIEVVIVETTYKIQQIIGGDFHLN